MTLMNTSRRNAVFQCCGGAVALIIAAGAIYAAKTALGEIGRFVLIVSVPFGVVIGGLTVKLLHFGHRILVDES